MSRFISDFTLGFWDHGSMSIRVAPLVLREADRPRLEGWVRASAVRSGLARRARIVLLAAEGLGNTAIAEKVGVSRPTVLLWRGRYEPAGSRRWKTWTGPAGRRGSSRPRSWWRRCRSRRRGWG